MTINMRKGYVLAEKAHIHGTFTLVISTDEGVYKGTRIGKFQPILEKQVDNLW